MRPLRYSITVTLDGCCDHEVMIPDEESHRYWEAELERANALLFGTLDRVDWNAELVQGDLGRAVQQLKQEFGGACSWEE